MSSLLSTPSARLLAVSAAFLLGAAGAQAESYEGVHPAVGGVARADVQAQAVQAARAPRQNVPLASLVTALPAQTSDRAAVHAEAVRAAANFQSGEVAVQGEQTPPAAARMAPRGDDSRAALPGASAL